MIVFWFACVYWGGVALNAVRIKKRTGRTPSLKPRGSADYPVWIAWICMIGLWAATPWLVDEGDHFFHSRVADWAGIAIGLAGLAGTWWCYFSLGNAWAISQDKGRTKSLIRNGPYGLARHPIYSFQWMIVAGLWILAPCLPLLIALAILTVCMRVKAGAEEKGLEDVFGDEYEAYAREVGRFFPRCCGPRRRKG